MGVIACCLGTGMRQDDEPTHSHDITTTRTKTHEKRGGISLRQPEVCLFTYCYCVQIMQ